LKRKCAIAALFLFGAFTWSTAMADPIHDAAEAGKVEKLRQILAEGAGVDGRAGNRMTPLNAAVLNGQKDMAELLRKHGARE
jgi:ankyrin repeat protein